MKRRRGAVAAPGGAGLQALVRRALREDLGAGDLSTRACLPIGVRARGRIRARQALVACGLKLTALVFHSLDPRLRVRLQVRDGDAVRAGSTLAVVEGSARSILAGERVALNFLQHLSGIATRAHQCVKALQGSGMQLLDTRKTHPGLRALEKYAVRCGGALNHRHGLHDGILIKDNHAALAGGVGAAVRRARQRLPRAFLAVEADTLDQIQEAVQAGANLVLLDNFTFRGLRQAVRRFGRQVVLEASGGIRPSDLHRLARTGVVRVSLGRLTHSVDWADIALEAEPIGISGRRHAHR
ncbi:MAG: carboxylating nicotinate-nucleotide diphosphorylase [Acidobacteriota bacterium]